MGGPENGNFPLLYVIKMSLIGGWVAQKSLKTPLRNIKMAPNLNARNKKERRTLHWLYDYCLPSVDTLPMFYR